MPKTVLLDVADGVATVTLNRPEAGNALNMEMGRDLLEAALACEFDPKVRAVVLTGTGRNFGFGGDVRGMSEQGEGVAAVGRELCGSLLQGFIPRHFHQPPVLADHGGAQAIGGVDHLHHAETPAGAGQPAVHRAIPCRADAHHFATLDP